MLSVPKRWLLWIPPVLWMAVIFVVSADAASAQRSSRIIGPVVRWLVPDVSDEALDTVVLLVRKCAHLLEYAILGILLFVAANGRILASAKESHRRHLALAFTLAVLYACTDELHQSVVPNRFGAATDVGIDAMGAACGLAALMLLRSRVSRR